jgi:hypothetical protein
MLYKSAQKSKIAGIELVGSVCDIKSLYNHSLSPHHDRWSEFKDQIAEEERIKALGRSFAAVFLHCFSQARTKEGEIAWQTHSIEVESPRLQQIFSSIFQDYPNWNPDATPYTFFPPFKPIVHRWDRIFILYLIHRLVVFWYTKIMVFSLVLV